MSRRAPIVIRNTRPVVDAETWAGDGAAGEPDRSMVVGSDEWKSALRVHESELDDPADARDVVDDDANGGIDSIWSTCVAAVVFECDRACALVRARCGDDDAANSAAVPPIADRLTWDTAATVEPDSGSSATPSPSPSKNPYVAMFRTVRARRDRDRCRFSDAARSLVAAFRRACHRITLRACRAFEAIADEHAATCDAVSETYAETLGDLDLDHERPPCRHRRRSEPADALLRRSDRTARRMIARWNDKRHPFAQETTGAATDVFRAHVLRSRQARLRRIADEACAKLKAAGADAVRDLRRATARTKERCDVLLADFARRDDVLARDMQRLSERCARVDDADAFHETVKAFCSENSRPADEVAARLFDRGSAGAKENRRFRKAWSRATVDWR